MVTPIALAEVGLFLRGSHGVVAKYLLELLMAKVPAAFVVGYWLWGAIRRNEELSAILETTVHFCDGSLECRYVLDNGYRRNGVEGFIGIGH